jgi:hypothetical protein
VGAWSAEGLEAFVLHRRLEVPCILIGPRGVCDTWLRIRNLGSRLFKRAPGCAPSPLFVHAG